MPLRGYVTRGVLRIEMGIGVNAFAALLAPRLWDETGRKPDERYEITNAMQFAKDTIAALFDEREDGSSLLSDVLDAATQKAIEDGSEWFRDKEYNQ